MNPNLDVVQLLKIGSKHHQNGRLKEAERAYIRILKTNPNQPDALQLLGTLATQTGEPDVALELIERAIRIRPNIAEYHDSLADAYAALGRYNESIASRQKAISLDRRLFRSYLLLGNLFGELLRYEEAVATFKAALQIKPLDAEIHNNLGFAYFGLDRFDEAFAELNEAARLQPSLTIAQMNLGHVCVACAKHQEAMEHFNRALAAAPPRPESWSSRVMSMHYDPGYSASALLKAGRHWNEMFAAPLRPSLRPHANDRSPERKLRIGYVSPDFRHHVVGQSILPLLQNHDAEQFEIYCYSSMPWEDAMSDKIRRSAHAWRNIYRVSDDKVTETIRADGIDILVDLAVHSRNNRLPVFARKPAPVQITYLGYCSTTGLEAMDYRLSDPYVDPADVDLTDYSEKTIRLPHVYLPYEPMSATTDVSPLPALSAGHITFGCLNNFSKCSQAARDLWAEILSQLPGSRLILHAKPGQYLDDVRERFERAGISADRLEFLGRQDWPQYVQTYDRLDIALDPFPYNGGITTCDALWMGVPVVTLAGQTATGRVGQSILSNVGLIELIAKTPADYVRMALGLAKNLERLKELRAGLRSRVEGSPLRDAGQLARDLEAAYRFAWQSYVTAPPAG